MKKKMFKGVAAGLSLLVAAGLASCAEPTLKNVVLIPGSVPGTIKTEEVYDKIGDIQLRLVMSDGTESIVNLTEDMIGKDVLAELATAEEDGPKLVTIKYENFEFKINLMLDAPEKELAFKFNLKGIQAAMKDSVVAPEENYKLFMWYWGDNNNGKWTTLSVADDTATGIVDKGITGCNIVYQTNAATEGAWGGDNFIGQTVNLDVSYNDANEYVGYLPEAVTGDLSTISANLKDGGEMPTEYDLYIWTWGGTISAFVKVGEDGKFNAPAGTTGGCYVLNKKGEQPSWTNKLVQTTDYQIVAGVCSPK